jgi:hypothetical protein
MKIKMIKQMLKNIINRLHDYRIYLLVILISIITITLISIVLLNNLNNKQVKLEKCQSDYSGISEKKRLCETEVSQCNLETPTLPEINNNVCNNHTPAPVSVPEKMFGLLAQNFPVKDTIYELIYQPANSIEELFERQDKVTDLFHANKQLLIEKRLIVGDISVQNFLNNKFGAEFFVKTYEYYYDGDFVAFVVSPTYGDVPIYLAQKNENNLNIVWENQTQRFSCEEIEKAQNMGVSLFLIRRFILLDMFYYGDYSHVAQDLYRCRGLFDKNFVELR